MTDPAPAVSGTEGYAADAASLIAQYDGLSFADVHRDVLAFIPQPPGAVLDVGAGTGRDAAALAARGFRVVAVEPTAAFRRYGQTAHAASNIVWMDDALPSLARVRATGQAFDLILLTAVWMHLDEEQRRAAMTAVAELLAGGGRAVMSLRHGPVPRGRRMFAVTADETCALAAAAGLGLVHRAERGDMLGRGDVRWTFLVFEAPSGRAVSW